MEKMYLTESTPKLSIGYIKLLYLIRAKVLIMATILLMQRIMRINGLSMMIPQ